MPGEQVSAMIARYAAIVVLTSRRVSKGEKTVEARSETREPLSSTSSASLSF
jgi:hypothetical protein